MSANEYVFTTAALAAEFGVNTKTIRRKAGELRIGIDFGGSAGFRYNAEDRRRLIESLKPEAPAPRKRRRAA